MSGFTPANQIRLTNVAAVRLQKKGRRFEIACYRNKVLSWRNKLESDLKEVLQIDTVFTNVSKGMLASSKDLMEAFGTTDQMLVCKEILDKGEIQVSEQERVALHETVFRDIASIVAEKTVNPNNNLPYTITMIQNAMRQVQFSVNVSKTSKSQALDVIRKLKDIIPITRASMLIRVIYLVADEGVICGELDKISGQIMQRSASVDTSNKSSGTQECFVDAKIDPEYYRRMEDFVRAHSVGRVEVIQMRMAGSAVPGGGSSGGLPATHSTTSAADGKEGDDVYPQGQESSSAVSSTTKSSVKGKEKEKEKGGGKRGGGRSGASGEDLEGLLAAITGQSLRDEEAEDSGSDPEYVIVNNNAKNKKKQKKNKAKQPIVPIIEDSDEDEDEEYNAVKNDDEDIPKSTYTAHDAEDDTAVSVAPSVSETITSAASSSTSGPARQKIGKKEKRLEKEMQKEREDQARALQRRLQRQQQEQQLQQQQAAAAAAAAALVTAEEATDATSAQTDATTSSATVITASSSGASVGESAASAVGKVSSCNTCTGTFADAKLYREHFKSDWHRFNLKRKMKNLPTVTSEAEFLCLSVEELAL